MKSYSKEQRECREDESAWFDRQRAVAVTVVMGGGGRKLRGVTEEE